MATFPYAFQKMMLATAGIVPTAGTTTLGLTAGQLAVVDPRTNESVVLGAATTFQTTPRVFLAQGSLYPSDKLTPFHGGYKQSIQSRLIDPRHISRFYYVGPADAVKACFKVTVVGTAAQFEANQSVNGGPHSGYLTVPRQDGTLERQETYYLRLDLHGSPVYRLLNRNEYWSFPATTICMPTGAVDRTNLLQQWADGINTHPIISKLVKATVNGLNLTICDIYEDTVFGDCDYQRNDHHEYEGIIIAASIYDERQVNCGPQLFTTTDVSVAKRGSGFGESVLQELILENEYQGNPFQYDIRMREVLSDTNLKAIDRTKKYGAYYLLYSVPRKQNSTSQLDNDRILLKIPTAAVNGPVAAIPAQNGQPAVPAVAGQPGTRVQEFEDFIEAYTASAGNPIDLEDLTSAGPVQFWQ